MTLFYDRLHVFANARGGSIAVTFAMMLTTLLIATGLSIDYNRSITVQSNLQNDLDAAMLAAAQKSEDNNEIKAFAQRFFGDNWYDKYGLSGTVAVNVTKPEDNLLLGSISAKLPTTFMALTGKSEVDIKVESEIQMAAGNIEVALVLDVTDSMIGPKIEALKDSAIGLIDKAYENERSRDHVRVAIVPFADYVNVGDINRNAAWMDVPLDSETTTETCIDNYQEVVGTSNCRMETYTYDRDGVPVTYQAEVCDYQYGPPTNRCFNTTNTVRWYGCAASRDYPLDVTDDQWGIPVPGAMNVGCGAPLMELTNDDAALRQRIEDITTFGNTYIPAGLFWGWTALSPQEPFATAKGYGEKVDGAAVEKVMVLMTDGANTRSPNYVSKNHSGWDVALANDRTAELCTNIKASGIKIYTVAFDVDDIAVKDMLRACASSDSQFYDAEDATELETAFANIGANLSPLRIAR